MISSILVGIMLFLGAIQDLQSRRIHAGLMAAACLAAAGLNIAAAPSPETLAALAAGALPGIGLWFLAAASRESIGRGDALAVLLTGLGSGIYRTALALLLALFFAAGFGCALLVMRRADKNSRLPFIPFLAAAYLLACLTI